jgi:uncharacterized Zn finger protein
MAANCRSQLERRAHTRIELQGCLACGASSDDIRVTMRTAYLLYLRCENCGKVWQQDMPQIEGPRRYR